MVKKMILSLLIPLFAVQFLLAAQMDSRVRAVPKALLEQVFQNPEENLSALVKNLTSGMSGADQKVKVLHDWICDNIAYDTDMYFRGIEQSQMPADVVKNRKAICSGYSNLMREMCRMAGVEAIVIYGNSKGFGYRGFLPDGNDHAWNAVKTSRGWQLIDVTWDAGYVDWRFFVKRYTTAWFSLSPSQFIYSHLPEDENFQYLPKEKRRTKEQFVKEPYLSGTFFSYGLSLGKNAPDYTNEITEATAFDFKISKSNVALMGNLFEEDEVSVYVKNSMWIERSAGAATVKVDIPEAKKYRAVLMARTKGSLKTPNFFDEYEFDNEVKTGVNSLLAEKKITEKEYEYFESAFIKSEENHRVYEAEDLFATARNNAVSKILKLLEKNTGNYEEVMYFDLTASADYSGYGETQSRFPPIFIAYTESSDTHLLEPLSGVIKGSENTKIQIASKDFSSFAVVIDGELELFTKNSKTGIFEMEIAVPAGMEHLMVMGSKNGRNFSSLWYFIVE